MHFRSSFAIAVSLGLAVASCSHLAQGTKFRESLGVPAKLSVAEVSPGVFDFKYDAPFANADGDFDFSKGEALGKIINLSFTIVDDQGLGLKFKSEATDAIWIVDKKFVGPDGSPEGPFRGDQFRDFKVSSDGRTLSLTNLNSDGVLYRYGLRFDRGAETVIDDPDQQNGTHTGGNN